MHGINVCWYPQCQLFLRSSLPGLWINYLSSAAMHDNTQDTICSLAQALIIWCKWNPKSLNFFFKSMPLVLKIWAIERPPRSFFQSIICIVMSLEIGSIPQQLFTFFERQNLLSNTSEKVQAGYFHLLQWE